MTGCVIQLNCVLPFRVWGFVNSDIYEHKPTQPWGIPRVTWWFLQGKSDVSTVPAQLQYISGESRGAFQQSVVNNGSCGFKPDRYQRFTYDFYQRPQVAPLVNRAKRTRGDREGHSQFTLRDMS